MATAKPKFKVKGIKRADFITLHIEAWLLEEQDNQRGNNIQHYGRFMYLNQWMYCLSMQRPQREVQRSGYEYGCLLRQR
jgi:hypothetical protein